MTGEADLAAIGTLLADRTRATILLTLLHGGLTPASQLAARAGASRSLASMHLSQLGDGGVLAGGARAGVAAGGARGREPLAGQHAPEQAGRRRDAGGRAARTPAPLPAREPEDRRRARGADPARADRARLLASGLARAR